MFMTPGLESAAANHISVHMVFVCRSVWVHWLLCGCLSFLIPFFFPHKVSTLDLDFEWFPWDWNCLKTVQKTGKCLNPDMNVRKFSCKLLKMA